MAIDKKWKVAASIYVTTDYTMFVNDLENRDPDIPKHKHLRDMMKKHGFLKCFPIIVWQDENGKWRVKDGQHRLAIAEELGLPVYFTVDEANFDVGEINRTQVKWTHLDFANRMAHKGLAAYAEIISYSDRGKFSIAMSAALLAGTVSFNNVENQFMNGTYVVRDRDYAELIMETYLDCEQANKNLTGMPFVWAIAAAARVNDFNRDRLVRNASRFTGEIIKRSSRDLWLPLVEDIYNFGRRDPIPLEHMALQAMKDRSIVRSRIKPLAPGTPVSKTP